MIGVARSGWVKGTEHAIVRLATNAGTPTRTVGAAKQREWRALCLSYAEGTSRSTRVSFANLSQGPGHGLRVFMNGTH